MTDMEQTNTADRAFVLWFNGLEKILSFSAADGFEHREFRTYEEMMAHAIQLGSAGYRIQ